MDREESPRCEAHLEVESAYALALEKALEPDNVSAPSWLKVKCEAREAKLICSVEIEDCEPQRMLSLRNTLDDMLMSLKSATEALKYLEDSSNKA
ncbi:MAG: KEOPS complex subunit Pcc1 [Acidilobaceae archaeon]